MADSLAGVALGAGSGTRMRPLSIDRPKVLCPVANVPLIDHAVGRLRTVTDVVAVNTHVTQSQLHTHLEATHPGVGVSVEPGERLGTAGALGALRSWIDGRATVVVNGDTWCPGGLESLVRGWDGGTVRILVAGGATFGPSAPIAGALMPWADVATMDATPSGLWEVCWRKALADGRIETVDHRGAFVDCADPSDYLRANLDAVGGSAIGPDAVVEGEVDDCVVWDGATVAAGEQLTRAIRTDTGRTVLVRR